MIRNLYFLIKDIIKQKDQEHKVSGKEMGYELRFFNNIDLQKENVKKYKDYSRNVFNAMGVAKNQIEKRTDLYLIYPCLGDFMNSYGIKFRNVNLDKKKSISLQALEVKVRTQKNQDNSEVWKKKFQQQASFINNIKKFPLVLNEMDEKQPKVENQSTSCYYLDQMSVQDIHNSVLNSLKQPGEPEIKQLYLLLSQFSAQNSGLKLQLVTKKRFMKTFYIENTTVKVQRLDIPVFKYQVGFTVCIENQQQGNVYPKQGFDLCCGFPEYLSKI